MRISIHSTSCLLLGIAATAAADAATGIQSSLTFTVRDGVYDDVLTGFDPTLQTMGEYDADNLSVTYGYDTEIKPSANPMKWPRLIWAKAVTTAGGWALAATGQVDQDAQGTMEFQADSEDFDVKLRMLASASKDGGVAVGGVELSKGFDVSDSTRFLVTPRYDVENEIGDVVVGCKLGDTTSIEVVASKGTIPTATMKHQLLDDTGVYLAASPSYQTMTVTQRLDACNTIAPTVDSNGNMSLEWERTLKDGDGTMTMTYNQKPQAIHVEWQDADWTAMIKLPMDGFQVAESAITVKRNVMF